MELQDDILVLKEKLSIDECRIPSKCRSNITQYNPNKPVKYGYTGFQLSEASLGFVRRFRLYFGKSHDIPSSKGLYDVVMSLVQELENKGYQVFVDS